MKRLPKGKTAQVMGSRFFQTMYTADQMRKYADKAVEEEREACAKVCESFDLPFIAEAIRERT
jgi:nucleoside phosphorylase